MVASTIDSVRPDAGPRFYVWFAGACALIAFGGFAETYWLQLPAGTFRGAAIVHLHAALFSSWVLFFVLQTTLAASGRMTAHRAWGLFGISLATAMVFVGVAAALNTLQIGLAAGYGDRSRAFLLVPVTAIAAFAGFLVAALANIPRPEWHKRFMVVATASLLQAAVARILFVIATGGGPGARPGLGPPPPAALPIVAGLIGATLLLPGVVYDWRTRGRPHPAYLIGLAVTIAIVLVRGPVSGSPAWRSTADLLLSFAR